jgi:hypothetical protein
MTKAWIITQEGTSDDPAVIGVLSARKSGRTVKDYVEWLYGLLHYSLGDQLSLVRYNRPCKPYKADYWKTNTGIPMESRMTCGHNPWLEARLATNVKMIDPDGECSVLEWTEPDRFVCDSRTGRIVEKIRGKTIQAPVCFPLNIGPRPSTRQAGADMDAPKRPLPNDYCTKCNRPSWELLDVPSRCQRIVNGNSRCGGTLRSANNVGDWRECPTCNAIGSENGWRCAQCKGDGWIFAREQR